MVDAWDHNKNIARSLLAQCLSNATLIVTESCKTVKEVWDIIVREYTYKSTVTKGNLRHDFMASRRADKADVHVFLNSLRTRRAEITSIGATISNDDYRDTIISSLPRWLQTFALNQLTASRLSSPDRTIDPELLIIIICDEWE